MPETSYNLRLLLEVTRGTAVNHFVKKRNCWKKIFYRRFFVLHNDFARILLQKVIFLPSN